ncbi:protein hook homolog [Fopius arisanus]|uniref:Protein hook homolog n=1 Tax=Fopius arisanus TaxID=64838 RepID=A0A9R1TAY9_9HYME|nr:PREDICTED: protein hook homolog [Fopius arisanus]
MSSLKDAAISDRQKSEKQSFDELLGDYAKKLVELDLIREVSQTIEKRLEGRKQDYLREKEKLATCHQQIWTSIDVFCTSISQFSSDHDFCGLINNYLDSSSTESSKPTEDQSEKNRFLQYQINLLEKEIEDLQDNIKHMKKIKLPLRECQTNNNNNNNNNQTDGQEYEIEKESFSKNRKQVTFQENGRKDSEKAESVENYSIVKEQTLKSILRTPKNSRTRLETKNSTFSLKTKSKICANYEKINS